jgi:urea transport system permease protein
MGGAVIDQVKPMWIQKILLSVVLLWSSQGWALTASQAAALAIGDSSSRVEALRKIATDADEATIRLIQAMADDEVVVVEGVPLIVQGAEGLDPVTGNVIQLPDNPEYIINNNRMRGEIDLVFAAIQLQSSDAGVRRNAIQTLKSDVDESKLPLIEAAIQKESVESIKDQLMQLRAAALLGSANPEKRIEAAAMLGAGSQTATKTLLLERLQVETDPAVKSALEMSLQTVDARLAWGDRIGVMFTGLSLGSILLLVALGLAITYGLMGVINMAHGELMMIGAYATYVVQGVFQQYFPAAFDWYLIASLPVAFMVSALVGAAMERGVIRYLYGRPLETLLATWGISLILMQLVRTFFGAQNVGVENPSWMSGGVQVMGNLSLPWNRIMIVVFAIAVLLGVAYLISQTRLGLFVRGVTQNRPMAACMGVNTARVDTYAFALGSGIAGLAGCALSQVGNVGPDLGQGYIVDSFMVVVLGGVGQLAGTVYAALGLGVLNKLLEGWTGAVLAKIAVLVLIIVFIQKRPQGIFAMKGRSAEA